MLDEITSELKELSDDKMIGYMLFCLAAARDEMTTAHDEGMKEDDIDILARTHATILHICEQELNRRNIEVIFNGRA